MNLYSDFKLGGVNLNCPRICKVSDWLRAGLIYIPLNLRSQNILFSEIITLKLGKIFYINPCKNYVLDKEYLLKYLVNFKLANNRS